MRIKGSDQTQEQSNLDLHHLQVPHFFHFLHAILAFLSALGLKIKICTEYYFQKAHAD